MPCKFGELVRESRSRPRKAVAGREWKRRVGVEWVGSAGGIANRIMKLERMMKKLEFEI